MAKNRCSQLSLLVITLLLITTSISVVNGQPSVNLSLNGEPITNGSYVLASDIGEGGNDMTTMDGGLLCITDNSDCCRAADNPNGGARGQGEWYFPNGNLVKIQGARTIGDFFYRNRDPGIVRLNRFGNPPEGGRFCCEVPNAAGATVTTYVNIVGILSMSTGSSTAGETYTLQCSVTGTSEPPTFQWLMGQVPLSNQNELNDMRLSITKFNDTHDQLQFMPLSQQLHNGSYCCSAMIVEINQPIIKCFNVTVEAPTIRVQVIADDSPPWPLVTGQEQYVLSLSISEIEHLDSVITYEWTKNIDGSNNNIIIGTNSSDYQITTLQLSSRGVYACKVTISSNYLDGDYEIISNSFIVTIQIPTPSITLSASGNPSSLFRSVGSQVTLNCTVELGPLVMESELSLLMVDTQLSRDRTTLTPTGPTVSGTTFTYTIQLNSFGRSDSGNYTCTAIVRLRQPTVQYLIPSNISQSDIIKITTGVYLSLKERVHTNDAIIPIRTIGKASGGLQCITDKRSCCGGLGAMPWVFLNHQTAIGDLHGNAPFYVTRNNNGAVILNRRRSTLSPTGLIYCAIPDATGTVQRRYAHIVSVTIAATSGTPTAGDPLILECRVNGINRPATFQWLGPPNNRTLMTGSSNSRMVRSNSTVAVLQFIILQASHSGLYTCRASVNNVEMEESHEVIINSPQINVTVNGSSVITSLGEPQILTCSITGAERLSVHTTTFHWTKYNGSVIQIQKNTSTLTFSSLSISDAGQYTCSATINSNILSESIQSTDSVYTVSIHIPAPSTVLVRKLLPPEFEITAGSSINLSCIVVLDTNVDVSVTINTMWTGPQGTRITPTNSVMENFTTYTSIGIVSAARSGTYTCRASVDSLSQFINGSTVTSESITITVSGLPPPTNLMATGMNTSITLTWDHPLGSTDAVERYEIYYNFTINQCRNITGRNNNFMIQDPVVVNGTQRTYTLENSTNTPIEEDSTYFITVTAINQVTSSTSLVRSVTTNSAAPTSVPLNVRNTSVNATSITIQWDEVPCQHRNGLINGYRVTYSGINTFVSNRSRIFTANQLLPRKEYIFSVEALSISSYYGPPAVITLVTHILQEIKIVLGGHIYDNNSIINIHDIGENDEALLCYTNASDCCKTPAQTVGEWHFPNGVPIDISKAGEEFYRDRAQSVVRLNRRNNATFPTGVYRCEIPDANGTSQNIYVGIYPQGDLEGVLIITELPNYSFDSVQVITCASAGGPATTIEWSKDGNILGDEYEQLKRIVNLTTAEYQSTLTLGQSRPDEVIGNYTCRVSNARGEDTKTVRLHGIQTTEIEKNVALGKSLSLNCTTDLASTNISWLDSDGEVLANTTTQQLTLEITEITDVHHNAEYTCHIIGPFGDQNKSITLLVVQPSAADSSSTVGGVVAALLLVLLLVVGISLLIVIFIVKRSKNKTFRPFHKPVQYKPRKELGDDDYPPAPTTGTKGESIEMKQNEEEKEKDYYFMDTSLLAGEHVKPIPVPEFSSHVERLHADRDKLFEMEYESMSKHPQSSHAIADIPHNKCKNRFANIFPYDSSRVKLKEISGEDGSDYINASHLDGYNKPKAYIGAQGPMPNTVTDFWRMIWEKKLPTVVMLTRCFEGRKKCEEYWPLSVGESVQPGHGLTITLNSTLPFAEYSLRKMILTCSTAPGNAPLKVTQYHFTGWPDHGVPQNGVTLINFIRRVRTSHPYSDSRPLLVHCSAGVGRTGAFIVLDSMLQRMQGEQNLNIYEFLKQLRAQRVLMVQTQAQYNFIHDALNELILCGDTEITAPNLRIVISRLNKTTDGETGYTKQFNLIAQMSPGYSESDYTQANMECNLSKNRYPNILPNDHFRVMLRAATATGADYINASFVDGYRQRGGYIATQAPMENTVNDFWRMVWDYQSRAIVMLCRMKEDGKEACCPFLPEHKGDSEVYGKIRVQLVSKETTTDYVIQQLEVSEDKPHPQGHASSEAVVKVGVFHYIRWPKHGTPRGTAALLDLIQHINKTQMTSGNKPITVMCNDGVGRTGTFICIHAQLERLKTEGVVDFFQSIKSARIQRAGLVPDVHQYILCHNLVADYLDGFDTYANFKELV